VMKSGQPERGARLRPPLLQPGRNLWRRTFADAAGVLVDAADYYRAFYCAAAGARRSVLISGWEFDSGVRLLRGADAPAGAEVRFLKYLDALCRRTPGLHVCVLAWNFHVVLAAEREWLQRLYFHWLTHERLHFRVDDAPIRGGSLHQKFVVIDGWLAFLGGMDLRDACWDDRRHLAVNPERESRGRPHKPYHDVQAYLAGGAGPRALEQYFFQRWQRAGGKLPPLPPPTAGELDFRPPGAIPLGRAALGFSRTEPHAHGATIREIERLFQDAIDAAERLIYVETQYFSSRTICGALLDRMRAHGRRRLDIVLVVNERAEALKEEIAVGLRQLATLETLHRTAADTGHALGCYVSLPAGATKADRAPTYIHSKLLIVDDRFLTIGSANWTNRSMGVDSELLAAWEAAVDDVQFQRRIRHVRVSLLAEHGGLPARADVRALVRIEGLVARLDAFAARPGARLQRHSGPTAIEQRLLAALDAQVLPFDPDGRAA
jgi:phospholipase D1/2